ERMMTTQYPCNRKTASWLCALLALAFAVPAIANIDGAIFTTTADGTTVNGNIYASKADVYLGGGPQNQNSNGLTNGNYYFKVTSPNAAYVTVCKFNDFDGDGTQAENEPRIPHWPVSATGVDGASNAQMDDNGCVSFTVTKFTDGSQTVTLTEGTFGPDWSQTAPLDGTYGACNVQSGVITCTLSPGDNVSAPDFGNTNPYCSEGCDLNSLIVTKDANPSLKRTFTWSITKDVDKTEIDTAAGGTATFH